MTGEVDGLERELPLNRYVGLRTDAAKKAECLAIAAEENVLTVVHTLAGGRIRERRGSTAESGPRLEHQHALSALTERRRRTEAGKPAPYDDRIVTHGRGRSDLAQMRRAINAR